ncbi:MAG: hypothetical protein R3A79_31650 [Nannocystaceae bacterium]
MTLPPLLHPLVDVPCPTLGDLLERAGLEASRALEAAARLAAQRIAAQEQVAALRGAILSPPWPEHLPPWPLPPRALTAGDVGRGLLATLPHVVEELLLDDPSEGSARRLREDVERWRRAAELPGAALDRDAPLARPFARRWAMTLTADATRPIGALQLLGHGVSAGMVPYLGRYVEGLVTSDVAELELRDSLAIAAERDGWRGPPLDPEVPEPYLDRHGGVAAVERALCEGPGVFLVGEAGSGRRALLRACQRRHLAGDGPPALRGFGFGFHVDYVYELPWITARGALITPPEIAARRVFALVGLGVDALLDPRTEEPLPRAWHAALDAALERSGDGDGLRLALGVTPRQREHLLRRHPGLAALRVVEVPAPTPLEAVMFAMCDVFALEASAGAPIDLARILWWRSRLRPEERTPAALAEPAPRHIARHFARTRRDRGGGLSGRQAALLQSLGLGEPDLDALLELEAKLFAAPADPPP